MDLVKRDIARFIADPCVIYVRQEAPWQTFVVLKPALVGFARFQAPSRYSKASLALKPGSAAVI